MCLFLAFAAITVHDRYFWVSYIGAAMLFFAGCVLVISTYFAGEETRLTPLKYIIAMTAIGFAIIATLYRYVENV